MGKPPRIERKIIEKNRRNKMKNLYSQLLSLLPNPDNTSKVVEGAILLLPDQIDEAVEHIKSMKTKLQKLKQKKELLLQSINDQNEALIEVEVHDMGPNLDVVLANGLQNYSTFLRIIKLLHQSGLQIAAANFANSSCIQLLHDNLQVEPKSDLDAATISRKLKEELLVSRAGASSSSEQVVEVESQHNLWDNYEIHHSNSNWGFEIPEVLLPGLQEYMITMNTKS